jgi:hypothetical protein
VASENWTVIAILLLFIGVVLGFYLRPVVGPSHPESVHGPLSPDFETAIGLGVPLEGHWTALHEHNDVKFWTIENTEILAVTRGEQAVLLFSYMGDVSFFDIYEGGRPRVTAEIDGKDDRLFVYATDDASRNWIYIDDHIDGMLEGPVLAETSDTAQLIDTNNQD